MSASTQEFIAKGKVKNYPSGRHASDADKAAKREKRLQTMRKISKGIKTAVEIAAPVVEAGLKIAAIAVSPEMATVSDNFDMSSLALSALKNNGR